MSDEAISLRKLKSLIHWVDIEGVDDTLLSDRLQSMGLSESVAARANLLVQIFFFTIDKGVSTNQHLFRLFSNEFVETT